VQLVNFENLDDFSRLLRRVDVKLARLRLKVHRILENKLDEQTYSVFAESILVDCRALFIENSRYKTNCTLQNFYKATNHPEYAEGIDEYFDRATSNGVSLREVIKTWVDKHIVHFDYVIEEAEGAHLQDVRRLLDRQTIDNLFVDIMLFARQYEEYRAYLYKSGVAVIEAMTGDPRPSETNGEHDG